ncbi:MAG: hypothetical protein JW929_02640 [Anaerolineales bacterium]|nr:hypothetical protein [Anaerolineales bacterium]
MWDIFIAFIMIGAGIILAFYQLRRWIAAKRWIHLVVILTVVVSEFALVRGFTESLIVMVFAVILAFVAENKLGPGGAS